MSKLKLWVLLGIATCSLMPKNSAAKVTFLPDYIANLNSQTDDPTNPETPSTPGQCEKYGFLTNKPDANFYSFDVKKNVAVDEHDNWFDCYTNKKCLPKFNFSSCPANFQLAGNKCENKYERCEPQPCPDGSSIAITCSNGFTKTEAGYSGNDACYKCVATPCPSGSAVDLSCDTARYVQTYTAQSGNSSCYRCDAKTCPSGSGAEQSCDTVNYNKTLTGYSGAQTCYRCDAKPCPGSKSCEYGCQTYDNSRLSMCGSICTGCKTCSPTVCTGFNLSYAPANASYTTCSPGCGNTAVSYKFTACNANYVNSDNYWCSIPVTDCGRLGYNQSTASCSGQHILRCPFDNSKLSCVTF